MLFRNHKSILSILLSLFAILSIQVTSYTDITPISDRTAEVRDAIVAAVPGVNSADEVTETHLATITSLNLRDSDISELKSGDFSGMTGLTSLNLYNNELSILPDGIFEGLTALTSLRLGGNTVDPLPIPISLEKIDDGQFKAVAPTSAPFDIVLPISATNGSIADSATSLTIAKGNTESSAVTVSRTADTTAAVTANIGTLPGLPRNHYGYALTKSDVLPLEVISAVTTTPPPIEPPVEPPIEPPVEPPTNTAPVFTDGSTAIRSIAENIAAETHIGTAVSATDANEDDSLTYALSGVDAASFDIEQTTGQLKTKAALDYEMKRVYIVAISVSDSTLTDTITVIISVIDVDDTPFVSTTLAVSNRTPEVRDAIVNAVPGVSSANEVTDTQLAAITSLSLRVAGITELKSGDFSGLTGLTSLNLYGNMLNTLPIGIFKGLTSLNSLRLGGNLVDPLPLIVSLQQIGSGEFRSVVHTAAPFDIVLPIGAMMVTIPKGSLTSAPFTDTSTPSIGALPGLPENHFGYILAKSTVYNRTPQVRDAIVAALSDVNNYRNVTEVDLATITTLNLESKSITSLKSGDFAGMLSLKTLNLNNNQLTSLPDGIFDGLVSLSELNLSGNSVDPLPLDVSLQKVGTNQFKAVLPSGAPFDITLPISVTNGNIVGNVTTLTIPAGSVESQPLTVLRASNTSAAVTVNIGSLPSLPADHTGYVLAKSNELPLAVFSSLNVSPVFTDGTTTTRTITENSEAGADIGSAVSATDANNDTLTYSLSGTDATSFDIDPLTGQLKTKVPLDYETKPSYSVTITVSDGLLTDTITVGISVTDVNENRAPVFTEGSSATRTVAENTGSGVDVGSSVSATDTDKDTLTYSLSGTDATFFDIDPSTGQLKTKADLDFETKSTYSVSITVSDGNEGSDTINVTITVTDVEERSTNNAPEFTDGSSTTRSVAENTGSGVNIGDAVSATDADDDTLTYSLGGTDAASFSINSTNGQLRTNAALDYETKASYSVSITVSDGYNGSDTITVTITVTDVEESLANNTPEFTDGSSTTRSVAENTGSGVNIGDAVSATDADDDTLTYSLGGTDAASFSINSTNGQLRTNAALDYETKSSYSVSITVSDGYNGNDTITVTITVTDVEESFTNNVPEFTDGSSTTRSVAENTGSGVNIGDAVSATDADDDTLTYSLGGTDASSFSINSTNGQLRTNASLDYETKASYSVTITVSDGNEGSDTITVTITVTNVDETPANNNPVFTEASPATRSIAENTTSGVNIGSAVSATDADNDTLTYGLTGTDASVFSIDNSNGQLQTSDSLDYETKSSYLVTVTVSDVNGGSDTITVTINITDANDAPVFADGVSASRTIPENTGANINIGRVLAATDADDDTLTYSLGGTNAASFNIDTSSGQLKTKSALDYETKISYTVTVSVSDGSLEDEITVTITVRDLDETPSNIAPVFTEDADTTRSVPENTDADTNIGTPIAATDADSETLAYVLSGTDASPFSIDDETGQLKTSAALNYETKDSYTVTVTVSDGSQNDTITVTINVTNANDAPVFAATNDTALTIAENTAAGTNIGTAFAASDEDNDTLTFSLGGTDAASYDIDSESGQLKTKSALDFETKPSYSVEIVVSDGNNGSDTLEVGITVTDVDENSAPVFTEGEETTRSIAENTGSGVDIGTAVGATDADGDTMEYELRGTDADSFSINSTSGQLRTKAPLDYETDPSYSVRIRVSDGNNGVARIDVTINVTDVAENSAPVFEAETTNRSVAENTASGVNIGTPVSATDADTDTLTYTLSGTDADSFSINSTDGQLRTKDALDFEGTKKSYTVIITVSDGKGGSDSISVTITVTDVNENHAPVFTDDKPTTRSVAENTGTGVDFGDEVEATDADTTDTLVYSLSGTNADSFTIDSTNGQLRTDAALDYETKNSYSVTVTVIDNEDGSNTITVTINVTDVNDAPEFIDGASTTRSVDENTAADVNIGTAISATDADKDTTNAPKDTLVYSLSGTDAASFDIDTGSGQLKTKTALDHETTPSYTVTVSVSDGNNGSDSITVEITVSDVNENSAPTFTNNNPSFYYIISNIPDASVDQDIGDALTATDPDNDTLTYTVADNDDDGVDDASFFSIDSSGQLKVTQALIDDTNTTYSIKVIANDSNGGTAEVEGTVLASGRRSTQVTNNTPVFTDSNPTTRSVAENTASGENIGDPVGATDADTGDTLTYTLGGTDADSFDIVSTSGQLQTEAALDYETKTSYTVTVTVTDDNGVSNASATITVTINITDVDEGTSITPVSDRTPEVRDAIVAAVSGVSDPADVTAAHLANINDLSIDVSMRIGLPVGDFDGLTGLETLTILDEYDIETLPSGIFDELTSLTTLSIESTGLNTLPSDIFDNLSSLTELSLQDNFFTSIPSGIFVNLTSLTDLNLEGNTSDPLLLPVSLELVQSGEFKAVAATGAPFDIVVPITVTNGTISGGATSVTISKGSVESSALTVTQNSGSTGTVNASIGTLPDIPSSHYGYELSKGETLSVISGDNSAPVFNETGTVTRTIDEGNTQDLHIGSPVTATDADNETLTYTLGGIDAASFSIDDKTGQLKTKAALDFETKSSYTVTVTATDTSSASNNSTTIIVTITVNDIVGETSFTPVSDRTPWMRDILVRSVPDVDVEEITAAHLAEFTRFAAVDYGYSSMKLGDFDGLTGLTYLDLNSNEFTSLPAGIFDNLTALTYLDVGGNELTSLPFYIFDNLTALTHLDLSGNELASLPADIFDKLTALTHLDLVNNELASLPAGIFDKLTALTYLDLSNNELASLPAGIFDKLTALTYLDVGGNDLTSLLSGIFDKLTALTHLDQSYNDFTSLPSDIFDKLTALTYLELRNNKLPSLPSGIFDQLTALTFLGLEGNELSSLPSGIFDQLTQLTWLNIADNGLSSLTDGIFDQLTQLTDLYMGTNELSSVPSGIFGQLSLLKILKLDNNHFSSLPDRIFVGLTSLDTFFISEQTDSNGNAVPALSLSLELEKVADGMFKAVAPAGAPYNIKIYLTLEDGVISGGQDYITIPQGSVESDTATVTRSPSDGTNVVNVSIDRVSEPGNHTGYSVSYDNTQVLAVIPAVNGAPNSTVEIPDVTNLLPNYPNPFNPETWIPYQLSKSADVTFTIYNMRGVVVRELALGYKSAGYYTSKNRAAYWNGRNNLGEKVAAGVYFSTFKAGDYTATRKMMIRK